MKQLEIGSTISRAWDLAVKHWPIFVLLVFINNLFGGLGINYDQSVLTSLGNNPDPSVMAEAIAESISVSPWLAVSVLLSLYLGYVMYRLLRSAIETGKPYASMSDAFKVDINKFAVFFAVDICFGIAVGVGTFLCIIPGIYLAIRWWFAPIIAATEDVTFVEAFRRSWQATSGNFWSLFLLGLCIIGIEILGLAACCVGYLFAAVVAAFALMIAYLELK